MSSTDPVRLSLDGREVLARAGETLLALADREGIAIPRLCHHDGYRPDGNCRACVVEIAGERALAPACCRVVAPGMHVQASHERARHAQRTVVELLLADVHYDAVERPYRHDSELARWARFLGLAGSRFPATRTAAPADASHPAITVRLDACIQCGRCVRACREEQANDVIGMAWRGEATWPVFDANTPMGSSTCVACGECVQACPTGALAPANDEARAAPQRSVDSLCPYCGVGCQARYHVRDDAIAFVEGRDGPANHGRLCVKGRYGFDYARHPQRLQRPLVRRDGMPKTPAVVPPERFGEVFREASWDEALDRAADGFLALRDAYGPRSLAGFGSAKGSNEEAYLFQKLVRTAFRTNNVDHCTRLCHASSVAALLEGLGSAAVSNPVADVGQADFVLVIGAEPVREPSGCGDVDQERRRAAARTSSSPTRGAIRWHVTPIGGSGFGRIPTWCCCRRCST